MNRIRRLVFLRYSFGIILGLFFLLAPVFADPNSPEKRDDGLVVISRNPPKGEHRPDQYLTMILKTGYACDPKGKAGLTVLTNELLINFFNETSALKFSYETYADFSIFNFLIAHGSFEKFCVELDSIIRMDALLVYDLLNERIQAHQNIPQFPGTVAAAQLDDLLFGRDHPYSQALRENYRNLIINDVNNWFRQSYRPNNLIISSSLPLPKDFLRKPAGRDFLEKVSSEIPSVQCRPIPEVKFTENHDQTSSIFLGIPFPSLKNEGFFASILLKNYLSEELWREIREKEGLCYDLQVSYSYLPESSAPVLRIHFQTLPKDTGTGIIKVISVLKKIAASGVPEEDLARVFKWEKNQVDTENNPLLRSTVDRALLALFEQTWLSDSTQYLERLNKVTQEDFLKILSEKLGSLKISVAGPAGARESLKGIYQEIISLRKADK